MSRLNKIFVPFLALVMLVLPACGQPAAVAPDAQRTETPAVTEIAETPREMPYVNAVTLSAEVSLEDEAVALSATPAAPLSILEAVASGTQVKSTANAVIDYSNTADGYVMVNHTAASSQRLKVQVKGPATTYTYNLTPQEWTVFPLSDGSGDYQVTMFQNVTGSSYAQVLSVSFSAALKDEFAPFLRPNQYVNYDAASAAVAKAAELTAGLTDPLQKVAAIYDFVVTTLSYDRDKAATVQSGYLPVLDSVLAEQKGICFDYAALMTGMLRSQGVPCKLVVGYAGQAYHAWISVWTEEEGWVDGTIFFDGSAWHRMDPTFASTSNQSESVMMYIGDGSNYTVKYLY